MSLFRSDLQITLARERSTKLGTLVGKDVVGNQGWKIGTVKDILVDTSSWKVDGFEVELDKNVAKEFGIKKAFGATRIPLGLEHIAGVGDIVSLKVSKSELNKIIKPGEPKAQTSK